MLADQKSDRPAPTQTAARALVRFKFLWRPSTKAGRIQCGKAAQSPLDGIVTVVREKMPAGVTFWDEVFEKKLPLRVINNRPSVRLEALGQVMDAAEALGTGQRRKLKAPTFDGLRIAPVDIFEGIRRQADEVPFKKCAQGSGS